MPEQRVERPNLEAIVSEAGSTFKAGVQTAQYALQLERDNATLTTEVGRLRKVVEEIATDDITLSERHGSGTSQMGSLRKHIACAALTPPAPATCPECNGPADQGFSRDVPPQPYSCSKCDPHQPAPATKPCPSCKKSARWPGILLLEGREEACPKCNGTGRVPAPEDER